MSLRLIKAVAETENLDHFHLGRSLVLLASADARRRSSEAKAKAVAGITKLAKLDFLLRYPTCLERVLVATDGKAGDVGVKPRERTCIEAKMVRFRYGPWDGRYRRWLGLLAARGLVTVGLEGRTIQIGLTEAGRKVAERFRADTAYDDLTRRADLVVKAVGAMPATRLKDFVYEAVPEIVDMKWGEEIVL